MTLNIYNQDLAKTFQNSDEKPDKQFSFLPTVLNVIRDLSGKTALDLGCGDGFFARALASSGAKQVIGIDNSEEQIRLANTHPQNPHITYKLGDIFKDKLPQADIVLAPFVINYAETPEQLSFLFNNVYQILPIGGEIIMVVDLPKGNNLKEFGSIKTVDGELVDGAKIKIDLYNGEKFICTLHSIYYSPQTLENMLTETGFKNTKWHKPIISKEGIEAFNKDFWKDYPENCDLGYLSAEK